MIRRPMLVGATVLAFAALAAAGDDGARLFARDCAGCHTETAEGKDAAPDIRCATRAPDAIRKGRDTAMPAFPELTAADISAIESHLADLCRRAGRTAAQVYASNCTICHGRDGSGGRDARWIEGPDIRCTSAEDWEHAVADGQGGMPAYAQLERSMRDALRRHVHGPDCPSDGK